MRTFTAAIRSRQTEVPGRPLSSFVGQRADLLRAAEPESDLGHRPTTERERLLGVGPGGLRLIGGIPLRHGPQGQGLEIILVSLGEHVRIHGIVQADEVVTPWRVLATLDKERLQALLDGLLDVVANAPRRTRPGGNRLSNG
jgi:hypothetical protein